MFNLMPVSLLIGALGGILYIISNHLSELENFDNNEEEKNNFSGFNFKARFAQYVNQLPLDTVKSQSLAVTKKALHRFRLALLKTDNHLMKLISKISQRDKAVHAKSNVNESPPDFWEKIAKPEEQIAAPAPKTPPHQVGRVSPFEGGEVKVDFAIKTEAAKKFFDIRHAKKTLKTKKSLK